MILSVHCDQSGLSALEFELDQHLDRWEEFEPLMEATVEEGLELSFHAPYRLPYTLVGYSTTNRASIENMYRPMLKIAEKWAIQTGKPRVAVFHAATAPARTVQIHSLLIQLPF